MEKAALCPFPPSRSVLRSAWFKKQMHTRTSRFPRLNRLVPSPSCFNTGAGVATFSTSF